MRVPISGVASGAARRSPLRCFCARLVEAAACLYRQMLKKAILLARASVYFSFPMSDGIRHHVIISGTGRAGTSFLVQLLTHLGLETGFEPGAMELSPVERAGFERDIRLTPAPYIIKSPWLCEYIDEVLSNPLIQIDHAIIPVREMTAAAVSRAHVQEITTGSPDGETVNGGLWGTDKAAEQEDVLRHRFTSLMQGLVRHDVPTTFLWYPRLVQDAAYLYGKLSFLLDSRDFTSFFEVFERVRRPEMVHHFTPTDN